MALRSKGSSSDEHRVEFESLPITHCRRIRETKVNLIMYVYHDIIIRPGADFLNATPDGVNLMVYHYVTVSGKVDCLERRETAGNI